MTRKCPCGEELTGKRTQKYCSYECKKYKNTLQHKNWRHRVRGKPKKRQGTSREIAQKIVDLLVEDPHALRKFTLLIGYNPLFIPKKTVEVFKPSARSK